jgi:hypothetical protein
MYAYMESRVRHSEMMTKFRSECFQEMAAKILYIPIFIVKSALS